MKLLVLLLILVPLVLAEDTDKAVREKFRKVKRDNQISYTDSEENKKRFKRFQDCVKVVDMENAKKDQTAEFTPNKFCLMTEEERNAYASRMNVTIYLTLQADIPLWRPSVSLEDLPLEKMWTDEEAVTTVQDQGRCGSCWAFAAAATLETIYKIKTGVLRKFSEEEFVDCSLDNLDDRDGCQGAWMHEAYDYAIEKKRLAPLSEYPYNEADGTCEGSSKQNGLVAATITGYKLVDKTEEAHIKLLNTNVISAAYQVTDRFYLYQAGIYMETTGQCLKMNPGHAVALVGYTPEYILAKNSWGTDWGDNGFVKFARNYHNCGLYNWSSYPVLKLTGNTDNLGANEATKYNPRHSDPTDDDDCQDLNVYNSTDADGTCALHFCSEPLGMQLCKKTCHTCGVKLLEEVDDGVNCKNNLERCADGVCRHRHICFCYPGTGEKPCGF